MNTSHIINQLIEAHAELDELLKTVKTNRKDEPEGVLCIRPNKKTVQFYVRQKDGHEQYLGKDKQDMISALARKRYNHLLEDAVQKELDGIEKCREIMEGCSFSTEQLVEQLPGHIRQFVKTDSSMSPEDVEKWLNQDYDFDHPREGIEDFGTLNGEKVRSKSEIIIANLLKHHNVPYIYEKSFDDVMPAKYRDFPDFTCLNRRTGKTYYWEHCGKFDDPKYAENLMLRIQRFASYGVYLGSELIVTMETSKFPLNTAYVEKMIKRYLL
jgi:hypothetical protein